MIRVDHVLPHFSALVQAGKEFFVCSIAIIGKGDLTLSADGLIQNLNGIKQLLAMQRQIRHGADMFDAGSEISIGQPLQLPHQFLALAIRQMLREQQTVNEQPQLTVREIPN